MGTHLFTPHFILLLRSQFILVPPHLVVSDVLALPLQVGFILVQHRPRPSTVPSRLLRLWLRLQLLAAATAAPAPAWQCTHWQRRVSAALAPAPATLAQPPGNCVSSLILDLLKPQCNAAVLFSVKDAVRTVSTRTRYGTRTLY